MTGTWICRLPVENDIGGPDQTPDRSDQFVGEVQAKPRGRQQHGERNDGVHHREGQLHAEAPGWSFARTSRVMFFPDQHLGRNTALGMGITLDEMPLWDPHTDSLGGSTTRSNCSKAK